MININEVTIHEIKYDKETYERYLKMKSSNATTGNKSKKKANDRSKPEIMGKIVFDTAMGSGKIFSPAHMVEMLLKVVD